MIIVDGPTFASIITWGLPLIIVLVGSLFIVNLIAKRGKT